MDERSNERWMSDEKNMTVSEIAKAFNVSSSTVKRRLSALKRSDSQTYTKNVKADGKGKRIRYTIRESFAPSLMGDRSVSGKMSDGMSDSERLMNGGEVERLKADLIKAGENQKQLVELMEKQQDQAHSERLELSKRLSEANALQLDLQQQLRLSNDKVQLLTTKQTEQDNTAPAAYSSKTLFSVGILVCLLLFALLISQIIDY